MKKSMRNPGSIHFSDTPAVYVFFTVSRRWDRDAVTAGLYQLNQRADISTFWADDRNT